MDQEFRDFLDLVKKLLKVKWILIIFFAVFLGIFVGRNFKFLSEVTFTLKNPGITTKITKEEPVKEAQTCCPHLKIGQVLVPPTPEKLPVIVVFEVRNSGEAIARQVRVFIDFGSSKVIAYEVIGPRKDFVSGSEPGRSVINLEIKYLHPHESAYIYAQTSHAVFSQIVLSSSDTLSAIEYNYSNYLAKTKIKTRRDGAMPDWFVTFLYILAAAVLVTFTIYFVLVLIEKFNKWLKMKW